MSFLYRTNKGRVVYNRRPKLFKAHDVLRITSKVLDYIPTENIGPMINGIVILALITATSRASRRDALRLLGELLSAQNTWISQVMDEEDINMLQLLADVLTHGAVQIEDFIKAYAKWRYERKETKHA